MKIKGIYTIVWGLALVVMSFLIACSQEKNTLLSKGWHNLNARDNSFFLARERTKELEAELDAKVQNNYNKVLYPVTIVDTNETKAYKEKTNDIIKKASKPINYHKNSMYVDDCYVLVGKTRVLRGEWKLAAETFKFVNAQGEPEERFESLTHLMRLFMLKRDFRSAAYIMDYLEKQPLESKKNIREFTLSKAQLHRHTENYPLMAKDIETAIPLMTGRKEKRARLYFILGQIYQHEAQDSIAYLRYKSVLKNNPSYELSFYTKLNLAQVASLGSAKQKKKTERYFKKLLRDKKNIEYKDKIYYEMALFEYKQKNYKKAIDYLQKSVYENRTNKYQKGASYLKLGEIHYTHLKNFENAKLYYDSTKAIWDPTDKHYKEIAERQKILEDFVKNLLLVRREDSLQRLAKMDSITLDKHIDKVIAMEEAERVKKEKQVAAAKKRAAEIAAGPQIINNSIEPADPSGWYFYNPTAISRGATDFKIKWSTRKLEDNWRRSTKEAQPEDPSDTINTNNQPTIVDNGKKDAATKVKVVNKAPYLLDIPFTEEQLEASNKNIKDGLYNVARIYDLKLKELEDALTTFEDLLKRYPDQERTPEILYFLHLIATELKNEEKAAFYKNKLINEHPKSVYAKMLLNPNYLKENKEENVLAAKLYKQAFALYERNDFISADSMLTKLVRDYPENDNLDRMKLLRILITGKTKNALVYQNQLQTFIDDKDNLKSPVLSKAQELLASSVDYMTTLSQKGNTIKASDVRYSTNTSKPHFVVMVYNSKKNNPAAVKKQLAGYIKRSNPSDELVYETAKLSDSSFVTVIKTFDAMYPSKQFREQLLKSNFSLTGMTESFYISDSNYLLFLKDKNVDTYMEFFKNNY